VALGRIAPADLAWLGVGLAALALGVGAEQRVRRRRDQAAAEFVPVRGLTG
jgi:hypothetical protein